MSSLRGMEVDLIMISGRRLQMKLYKSDEAFQVFPLGIYLDNMQ